MPSCFLPSAYVCLDNFELASLPTTSPEDRKRLLSFVICGGGPTGVETAAVSMPLRNWDLDIYFFVGNIRSLSRRHHELCQ